MIIKRRILVFILAAVFLMEGAAFAIENPFFASSVVPETQSGFMAEAYEAKVGKKLERGVKNTLLGGLEIPHGVKSEINYRKQEDLHVGVETFFIGAFKGTVNALGRTAVGLYEVVTFPYAQGPVIEEMDEWLY